MVQTGLAVFRREYRALNWLQSGLEMPTHFGLEELREPDSLEIKLLHLLIDMDGDFKIEHLPVEGEQSIVSRVIFYRLGVLGLYEGQFDIPYAFTHLDTLFAPLRKWIQLENDHLKLIHLSGNVPELIRMAWKFGRLEERVLCFKHKPKHAETKAAEIKLKAEPSALIANEEQLLDEVEVEMKTLMPKKEASILGAKEKERIKKAIAKKTRKRQSRAERLRNEMEAIVDELKTEQKAQALDLNEFDQQIKKIDLSIETEKKAFDHLVLDIKELKSRQKQPKKWKKDRRKLEKQQKDLRKEKAPSADDQRNLEILRANKNHWLQKIASKPNDEDTKNRLATTQKEIDKIKKKFVKFEELKRVNQQLRSLHELQNQFLDSEKELDVLKNEKDQFEHKIKQLDADRNKIKKARKKDQEEFEAVVSKRQKSIQRKHDRFKRLLEKLKKIPRRFRRELKEYLTPEAYQKVTDEIINQKESAFFDQLLEDRYNHFLIRLLQVHQWTNGYYNGVLDSDLGERTFSSICEIDQDIESLKLRFVLYQLDSEKGTWLLNIRYFFEEMIDSLDEFKETVSFDDVVLKFEEEIIKEPKIRAQKGAFEKQWNKAVKEIRDDFKNKVVRRIYYGIRSIARSIIRGLRRIIKVIFSGVNKLIRLVRNFVHMLYREVREGLRKFAQGMAFLFGKRQITTQTPEGDVAVVSRFDFDCDATVIVGPNANAHISSHLFSCNETIAGLDFSLVLVARVIKWILRVSVFGWSIVMMRIALYFKRIVKEFLVKQVIGTGIKVLLG